MGSTVSAVPPPDAARVVSRMICDAVLDPAIATKCAVRAGRAASATGQVRLQPNRLTRSAKRSATRMRVVSPDWTPRGQADSRDLAGLLRSEAASITAAPRVVRGV